MKKGFGMGVLNSAASSYEVEDSDEEYSNAESFTHSFNDEDSANEDVGCDPLFIVTGCGKRTTNDTSSIKSCSVKEVEADKVVPTTQRRFKLFNRKKSEQRDTSNDERREGTFERVSSSVDQFLTSVDNTVDVVVDVLLPIESESKLSQDRATTNPSRRDDDISLTSSKRSFFLTTKSGLDNDEESVVSATSTLTFHFKSDNEVVPVPQTKTNMNRPWNNNKKKAVKKQSRQTTVVKVNSKKNVKKREQVAKKKNATKKKRFGWGKRGKKQSQLEKKDGCFDHFFDAVGMKDLVVKEEPKKKKGMFRFRKTKEKKVENTNWFPAFENNNWFDGLVSNE